MRNRLASLTAVCVAASGRVGRKRKGVAFLTVCLAAAVGVLVGPVQLARASVGACTTHGFTVNYGGGYYVDSTPPIGSTVNAHIGIVGSHIGTVGTTNTGVLGVTIGGNGVQDNLRIGIKYPDPNNDPTKGELYFDFDGSVTNITSVPFSATTTYHVWIVHDAANQWSMHYSGTNPENVITYNNGPWNQTYMFGSAGSSLNQFEFHFNGLVSPYDAASGDMTPCANPNSGYAPVKQSNSEFYVSSPS